MLCFAVCCGERCVLQQIEISDMIYSMIMCCAACWITCCIVQHDVVFCGMLWWAVCFTANWDQRYDVQHDDVLVGILWWAVCCAACWVQRYDVQHDAVLVGMLDNMLYWALDVVFLRHVVVSGMFCSKLCSAAWWRSDKMIHWSACWALCCVGQLDGQYVGWIGWHD